MAELIGIALLAYRNEHYSDAAALFEQAIASDPQDWIVRLYLGLSYGRLDQYTDAFRHLSLVISDCPDEQVRQRAADALRQLDAHCDRPSRAATDNQAVGGNQ